MNMKTSNTRLSQAFSVGLCVFTSLWYVDSQSPIVHHYVISLWWTQYVRNNRELWRNNELKHSDMKWKGDERYMPWKYKETDEFREKDFKKKVKRAERKQWTGFQGTLLH